MKVLTLNDNPKPEGNTALALREMERIFHSEDVETKIVQVGSRDIRGCVACGGCAKLGRRVFDDIVNELAPKFEASDGLVVANPVYYASANATLVALLTRLFYSTPFDKTMKVGTSVVVARWGGLPATFDELNKFFTISGMPVASIQYWNSVHGKLPGEVAQDGEGLQTMRVLEAEGVDRMTREQTSGKRKRLRAAIGVIFAAILLMCAGFAIYVGDYYHADETAVQAMAITDDIAVSKTDRGDIVFMPSAPRAGLIFYPGGKVEYTAYAPLMRACAERGILCVLVKMPCNLAVLDMNAADGIAEQYPDIDVWYVGGHSLGGAMAAAYAANHSGELDGLILLAAYSTKNLKGSDLNVLSAYGSEDQVLNMEKYREYRKNLPDGTVELVIEGGCHAGFGSYGPQKGDGSPAIAGEEQAMRTASEIANFTLDADG